MSGRYDPDEEDVQPEEISFFEFIDRTVNLALQAHGVWNIEVSETVKEIVQVAESLSRSDSDISRGIFDLKKLGAADKEAYCRAMAISMAVATELFGWSRAQMAKKLAKYLKEFGDS